MGIFVYRQNNSGGTWIGPAAIVAVVAENAATADTIAENAGVYFDSAADCNCCGSRWGRAIDPGTHESRWGQFDIPADTMLEAFDAATDWKQWEWSKAIPALAILR